MTEPQTTSPETAEPANGVAAGPTDRPLNSKEAALFLGISERTLWGLTKTGEIPHVPVGKRLIRYDLADLRAYWDAQKRRGIPDRKKKPPPAEGA